MGKNKTKNIDLKKSVKLVDAIAAIVFILLSALFISSYLNNNYLLNNLKSSKAFELIHAHNSDIFLKNVFISKKDSLKHLSFLGNRVIRIDFFSDTGDFSSFTPDKWEKECIKELKEIPDTFCTRYYSLNGKTYFEYLAKMPPLNLSSERTNKNVVVKQPNGFYKIYFPETLLITPTFKRLQNDINKKHIVGSFAAFILWLLAFIFFRKKTKEYSLLMKKYTSENESNFEIIQLSPNPIFIGDSSGYFIQFNKVASTFTGFSEEELKKMKMDDLFPDAVLSQNPLDYGSVQSGKTVVAERLLRKKDGSFATVRMSSKKLPSDRLISTMVDITKEKADMEKIIGVNNMLSQSVRLTNSAVAYINKTTNSMMLSFGVRELLNIPLNEHVDCHIIKELYDEKDYRYIYQKRKKMDENGETFFFEHEFKLPDGKKIWVSHSEKLIVDKKTRQKTLVIHFKDITESKRQRTLLEERDKLFSSIINTAQVGLAVFNTKVAFEEMAKLFNNQFTEEKINGLSNKEIKRLLELTPIVKFNNKLLDILGVTEATGLTLNLILNEQDYDVVKKVFLAMFRRMKTLEVEIGSINLKTKEYVHGLCMMSLPLIPDDYSLYVSWTDISKLKKIEAELRDNLRIVEKFMDTAPIAVIMLDRKEKVSLINKYAMNLLHVNENEFEEKSFFSIINSEEKAQRASLYFRKLVEGKTVKFPHKIIHLTIDGRDIHLRLYFTLIKDDMGRVENVLVIGLDVTDENRSKNELNLTTKEIIELKHKLEKKKKILEKQNKLLREKEISLSREIENKNRFFSIIAHDVRSPFTSLLGLSALLENNIKYLDEEEVVEIAEGINNQAKHIYNLLDNLLQWARSQLKQISFNPTAINLKDAIIQAVVVFKPSTENKDIELVVENDISGQILADEKMLDTILRNILSNAVKFTPTGGKITVGVQEKINFFEISISDSGIGIPKEDIEKLFDFSVHYSRLGTNKEKGSGLGLILVQEFVEKMNGRLTIKSEVGAGTTVSVMIPKITV